MNGMGLFLLGRRLMQIAEHALPQVKGKIATSVRLVLADIAYHPNSSISEITERTGFPQSQVSTAVAKLREVGVVETELDASDRRKTIVRTAPALEKFTERAAENSSIDGAVASALAAQDMGQLSEAIAAINLLARLLTPEVLSDQEPRPLAGAISVQEGDTP
ncbi:MAG: helix-turn-helix domain-containing protein [Acidimicrobiales bacterium]